MDPSRGGVSNGYYGDSSSGSGGRDNSQQPKDDFEDYMWMANEEEVEKEMLKQFEEEQMAQACFNEMMEDEARLGGPGGGGPGGPNAGDQANRWQGSGQMGGWSTGCPPPAGRQQQQQQPQQAWSTCPPAAPTAPEDALAHNIASLSVNDRPKVELNPMAAEFVPGQSFQPGSG